MHVSCCTFVLLRIRSETLQNESSRIFRNFLSRISFRSLLRIFPEFFEEFSCFVSQETETKKVHQTSPPFFNAKFPGKYEKNIHYFFLESRQSIGNGPNTVSGSTVQTPNSVSFFCWGSPSSGERTQ